MQPRFHASQVIFVQLADAVDDLRFASRIIYVSEGAELWIGAPTLREDEDAEVLIDPGTEVILEILRPDGIRRFPAFIRKRIPGTPSTLVVDWPRDVERIQRRNDVRVEVALPVELETVGRFPGLPPRIATTTVDLSAGGIRVITPESLPSDVQVRVRLKLPDRDPLLAHGTVLRGRAIDESATEKRYWAAIRFTAIDERDRQEIARAVFNIQRDALRKGHS